MKVFYIKILWLLAGICLLEPVQTVHEEVVRIGGLFQPEDWDQELAFRYAVSRINMNTALRPRTRLDHSIKNISALDSFATGKRVCDLTKEGVVAIIGPQSPSNTGIVESICDTLEIPNIQYHWETSEDGLTTCSINIHPDPPILAQAVADLVQDMGWNGFTIIYEDDASLIRLQQVLKLHGPSDHPVTVRQLDEGDDHRPLLKDLQGNSDSRFILDCSLHRIQDILRQAKEVKMLGDYQSYVLTNLDAHTLDFTEFQSGRTNITTLRLVDPERIDVQYAVRDWIDGELMKHRKVDITPQTVKASTALVYDAVQLFARAYQSLDDHRSRIKTKSLNCDSFEKWKDGYKLVNYIKLMEHNGLSGKAKFDEYGRRTFFQLDICELSRDGFKKIGSWDPENKINYTRTFGDIYSQIVEGLQNKTFKVVSRLGAPYLMFRQPQGAYTGNDRFEGYSINLIDEIAKILKFKYEFYLTPDGKYGSYNKVTKKWDGLVKELLERKADLALCDLTITFDRKNAVDFTMPFMTLGISILYSKPVKQPPNLFSFLSPFSLDVWMYMATAYLGVSLLLFVLARMTPDEWSNPHPCNENCEELENSFNLVNCLWLGMGSLMGQGCDILPKAVSTRMVAGMWWFFTLIMISSYTANLAAFLTSERMDVKIENAEDLAKQTKIKYGAVLGGSTLAFFKNSNFSTYQRMWAAMESAKPSVFTTSNDEGVERVLKGKRGYAFIMESTSIEYQVERNCDLQQIGGLLDSKGYGIAMPMNSPYRTAISGAVLKLQESGMLHMLKEKWWKEMYGGGSCDDGADASADAAELGLANVGGVFVVLALGCAAAFLMAILEFLWNIRKIAVEEGISPKEALVEELKFAIQCKLTTKPVRCKKSESKSSGSRGSSVRLDNFDQDKVDLAKN